MKSYQECVAHEAEDDRCGTAHRLVPHCSMVGIILARASRVSLVDDPHLLSEEILCNKINCDHDDEASVEHKQPRMVPSPVLSPSALQDQPHAQEVEHDRSPYGN